MKVEEQWRSREMLHQEAVFALACALKKLGGSLEINVEEMESLRSPVVSTTRGTDGRTITVRLEEGR